MAAMTRQEVLDAVAAGRSLPRADLTCANLTHANLTGADLSRAGLSGANLAGADLTRADLTHANLTGAEGIVSASGVGSERRTVYAWRGLDGWMVGAGCWTGTTAQLRERVESPEAWPDQPDADCARWRAQYVAVCDLIDATAAGVTA